MPSANDQTDSSSSATQNVSVSTPFLHVTPEDALGELTYKSVPIGNSVFKIAYPGDADKLLDHPSTHEAFHADDYMPYWAELWPASKMLAQALISASLEGAWTQGQTALEIGCGVGLPGVVALSLGLRVIFSDYDATAVEFAANNARANGFDNFERLPLDWRVPPDFTVPLILAADVIYEERNIPPLIALIESTLAPGGLCLLSDPDRSTRGGFRHALKRSKLSFSRQSVQVPGPENRQITGSVYRISV